MNTEQKKVIKNTILECREILEKDIEQVLINYGIYVDKNWINIRDLHLSEEQENARIKVESAIEKLQKGGFDKNKAVKEYIKEVSYTNLNRLAALRVMEVRCLIEEILIKRSKYGDKSFIGSRFYEIAREYCKFEMDGGLSYLLNIMYVEISEEIQMLFNMEDEYSFVFPSCGSLLNVIGLLCNNIDEESWKQDEIIGWVYQYFNDKEKDDVFDRLYNKKEKIRVEDIPAATQLFTPDWIVEWIVGNSLGTLWDEIKDGKRESKKVEEIKLLDPCCGSGHFLVKAYDLFFDMYVQEGKYTKEEIPYKILENNIYGTDIDLRAVQLTGLILFIKTKSSLIENGFDTNIKRNLSVNLVCADSILLNGSRLEDLKEKHKNNKTILKMLEIVYEEFEDVRLKGSLIQPEKRLFPLFEEFKNRIAKRELSKAKRAKNKQTEGQENILKEQTISFSEYKSQRDFTKEERELMISLDSIYSEAIKANDISRQLFANEAKKTIKLVDIFMNQYDVVVTNPPYMSKRNMNDKLKAFIDKYYIDSNFDLYSVFIRRCSEFIIDKGFLGMITQQTFMFTKMFEKLRTFLLDSFILDNSVHLGTRAFGEISGEKVNTVMFVYKKESNHNLRDNSIVSFIDLRMYKTEKEKLYNLIELNNDNFYKIEQRKFRNIDGNPFIYWIPDNILDLFNDGEKLDDKSEEPIMYSRKGLTTGDNGRFLRFHWEIKEESLNKKWFMLSKGETDKYYYFEPTYVVNWEDNGYEIRNFRNEQGKLRSRPQNIKFYFREGLTYTLLGGNNFKARFMEEGNIFEANGPCIFPNKISLLYSFGFLNSALCKEFLYYISPTLAINVSDIDKLPFVYPSEEIKKVVEQYAKQIIAISKNFTKFNELNKKYFISPELVFFKSSLIKESAKKYLEYKYLQEIKIILYSNLINDLIYKVYNIGKKTIDIIDKNQMSGLIGNIISNEDLDFSNDDEIMCFIEKLDFTHKKSGLEDIEKQIFDMAKDNISINDISHQLDLSIFTIYKTLTKGPNYEMDRLVKNLISYFIGEIIGRFSNINININPDGILPMDASVYLEQDITEQLYWCICEVFGEENNESVIDEIEEILGVTIEQYMKNKFFDDHKNLYQKRPIYWHICSPKKTFNCFLYYHKLTEDTLYKVKSIYLGKMIERYKDDLKYYSDQLIVAKINSDKTKEKDFRVRCSDLEFKLDDLYNLDKRIMEILPYKPVIDQGVLYNIIPLEPILSSSVSTDKEREEYYKEVKK